MGKLILAAVLIASAFFVATALTIMSIGLFRLVDDYLPGGVWATYLVFGGTFVVAGTFWWARSTKVSPPE